MPPQVDVIPTSIPRAALVTGGGKRLGRAIALALATHGFDIAIQRDMGASRAGKSVYIINVSAVTGSAAEKMMAHAGRRGIATIQTDVPSAYSALKTEEDVVDFVANSS